jgi:hypothetical protein
MVLPCKAPFSSLRHPRSRSPFEIAPDRLSPLTRPRPRCFDFAIATESMRQGRFRNRLSLIRARDSPLAQPQKLPPPAAMALILKATAQVLEHWQRQSQSRWRQLTPQTARAAKMQAAYGSAVCRRSELVTSLRFASNPGANFFDSLLQFRKVRPRPVDLFAARTAAELFVIDFGERLEFVDYVGLGCLSKGALHRRHRAKGAINSERSKRRTTSIVCSSAFWERGQYPC